MSTEESGDNAATYVFGEPQDATPPSAEKAKERFTRVLASIDAMGKQDVTRIFNLLRVDLAERIALAEADSIRHRHFRRDARAEEVNGYRQFYIALLGMVNEILALHCTGWANSRFHMAGIFRAVGDTLADLREPAAAARRYVDMHLPAEVLSGTTQAVPPAVAAFVEQGAREVGKGHEPDDSGGWKQSPDGAPSSAAEVSPISEEPRGSYPNP